MDEWTGGNCTTHYMTLGGGPMKMTVDAADDWCNTNSSCHGFTFKTNATGETEVYFRDETQIFFMDSQLGSLWTLSRSVRTPGSYLAVTR